MPFGPPQIQDNENLESSIATCLDLFRWKEAWRSRAPEELAESVHRLLVKQLALEVPDPESVIDFVPPPADGCSDITTSWVPFDVRRHEMLRLHHNRHVRRVDEFQHTIHAATTRFISRLQHWPPVCQWRLLLLWNYIGIFSRHYIWILLQD